LGVVAILPLLAAGPALFAWAFGAAWAPAGHYARLMSAFFLTQLVASPLTSTLTILRRQRVQFVVAGTRLAAIVVLFALARSEGWGPDAVVSAYAWLM